MCASCSERAVRKHFAFGINSISMKNSSFHMKLARFPHQPTAVPWFGFRLWFQLIFIERCEHREESSINHNFFSLALALVSRICSSLFIVMEITYFFFFILCGGSCYRMPCKNRISIFYFAAHRARKHTRFFPLLRSVQSIILFLHMDELEDNMASHRAEHTRRHRLNHSVCR